MLIKCVESSRKYITKIVTLTNILRFVIGLALGFVCISDQLYGYTAINLYRDNNLSLTHDSERHDFVCDGLYVKSDEVIWSGGSQ